MRLDPAAKGAAAHEVAQQSENVDAWGPLQTRTLLFVMTEKQIHKSCSLLLLARLLLILLL
jgi:hypothetical protein